MGSLGEAVLDLTADANKLDPGLNEGKTKVTTALGGLKSVFGEATGTMLGQLSASALRDIGQGIISVGKDITSTALDAEKAQAQLNAVLKSTEGIAGLTADQLNELAEGYASLTMFDDEAIIGAESVLLTFTQIGEEVFPTALESILDVSQALGQDLQSSTIQIGKALNDPIEGLGALRRVGVSFTQEQEDLIKTLVESGNVMEAQKIILAELQKEFGGSAEAAGETMAGQLAILNNEFENVKEEAGEAFIPVLKDLVAIAKELMPYLTQAVEWFSSLPTPVKMGVVAFLGLIAVLAPLIGAISSIVTLVGIVGPALASIGAALLPILPIILLVVAIVIALYLAWKTNFGGMRDVINGFISIAKSLWQALLAFLRGDTDAALGHLRQAFETYVGLAKMQFERLKSFLTSIWNGLTTFLRTVWQNAWNAIVAFFTTKVNDVVAKAKDLVARVKAAFNINWSELGKKIIDGLIAGLKNGAKAVADAARSMAQ
ncbi:MAG: phage tail length tape measure family protein, partial [Anaerolineae bacterium]|nr:phage tail length tape measure family protein [Anaerolineae bacterium]